MRKKDSRGKGRALEWARWLVGVRVLVRGGHLLPRPADQFALGQNCVAEKSLWINPLCGVMRAGINATWRGQLRAEIASVRFVSRDFLFLHLHLRRRALLAFDLSFHFFHQLERMHVDVAVRTKLGAFAAADTPVFNDDLQILLAPDRTDRALRHAKWIAAGSTCRRDEKMFIPQTVTEKSRDAVVRLGARAHTRITARTILEIDEQKILRFE